MFTTMVFLIFLLILYNLARPLFIVLLFSALIFFGIGFGIGTFLDSDEDTSKVKSTDVLRYQMQVESILKRLNKNTWDAQLYFIEKGEHQLAEAVIGPKEIFDREDVHYMSITPFLISQFIKDDKSVWSTLPNSEDEKWKMIKREHESIILSLTELRKMYPSR